MIKRKRFRNRLFSIIASFLMLFSLLNPGFVSAESTGKPYDSLYKTNTLSESKLSERLAEEFKEEDKVRFLVRFKDKTDSMKVAKEARQKAQKNNLSAYQQKFQQRSAVISALKTTSLTSQANVKQYLEDEIATGNAEDLRSYFIINGLAITATKEVAERIATFPEVEKVLPNETRYLIETDIADVIPESQLENVEWNVDRVNAPDVWSMGFDGTGAVVANLDSGVDLHHPALERKYRGYDEETGEFDHTYSWLDEIEGSSYPTDGHGHGTHVMGTMVGSEEDESNQVGVAPGAKWIAVKVFNAAGSTSDDILLNGAEWIAAPGGDITKTPDVVNNSWGGGSGKDDWYMEAVDNWRALDIFPAFAAGNVDLFNPGGPGSVAVPASYPQSFAVGNTTNTDALASSSLRGPSPYDGVLKPEVSAPGTGIRSSMPGGGYGGMSGTSMATPAVAGVVALLRGVNNNLSVEDLEEIIMSTARERTDAEYPDSPNNGYGYGIVDAFAAVTSIADGLGTIEGTVTMDGEDTEAPVYEHTPPAESYSRMDLPLSVFASDNVSITSVELHYDNKVLEAKQVSGNHKSGDFEVRVPGEDLEAGEFTYTWVINDYGNNEVVSEEFTVPIKSGITTGYFEDFESGDPIGWYTIGANSAWEWGEPTSGPGEAYSGDNLYATNLDGDYNSSMDATLIMPPIDVPEEGNAYIQFKSWHHFEYSSATGRAWDYGQLVISTDLENWTVIRDFEREREEWVTIEEDLSAYSGERVYIGFYTSSDGSVNRAGWYIDDLALTDESIYANDNEPPTFEHEAPAAHYEGIAFPLTIEVFDNLRVGGATLHYLDGNNEWQDLEAVELKDDADEENFTYGIFQATVPGSDISGSEFTYKWTVRDYNNNEVESDEYRVELVEPVTVGYFEDFEGDLVGWRTEGSLATSPWEHGVPTSGPEEAYSGENVYATVLDGEYPHSMREYLIMPVASIPAEGNTYLEFQTWHIFEQFSETGTAWDYGEVRVTRDFEEWTPLAKFTWQHEYWHTAVVDLSEYAGETIGIAFYAYSDSSGARLGWYIDDVELTDTPSEDPINTGSVKAETGQVKSQVVKSDNTIKNIPLEATVSVLETDRSTTTDPRDGSFSLLHEAGSFTVVAESYGFYSNEETVEVEADGVAEVHLVLEELPKATVSGTVTNKLSGEAIEGATLLLIEDANVQPVETDADGNFDLTAYVGDYTIQVIADNYEGAQVPITLEENMTVDIELDPFFAVGEHEIGYDDGTAENARAFYDAGNGWAVKMSLPEGRDKAIVTDGVFQFHDADWPSPGGTPFAVEVWSAGDDGMPGKKLAGPVEAEAIRDLSEWTVVDLRSESIEVTGDFFMVYIQTQNNTQSPGLATDEDSPNAGRSYQYVGGMWEKSPADEGNYMIRARVAFGVDNSVITSPEDGHITNETTITVEGNATSGTAVELSNNGSVVDTVDIDESGEFAIDVDLTEGENVLGTKTYVDGELAKIDDEITVILDTLAPELTVTNPENGAKFGQETITVDGTVYDEHFDFVEINGKKISVEDGSFSERIMLDEGENTITVSAYDLAGNVTTEEIVVTAKFTAPVIENLKPARDTHVGYGETVLVEFYSEAGLDATFSVLLPLTNVNLASDNSFEMEEVSEGRYVGMYQVTELGAAEGAIVEVTAIDAFGNKTIERAEGKLFLDPTVDRINGSSRYDTAVEISQAGWESADTVVLARGDDYADALTGVPLAKQLDAPILLTRTNELVDSTLAEIERLGASKVVILGGTLAISDSVEAELVAAGLSIERIYGGSRYETAAEVAKRVAPEGTGKVVIASGLDFPDALSVASYAAAADMPILLTRDSYLPTETEAALQELGVSETIVVGGSLAVSEAVFNVLPNPERLYGSSRYDTNIAIAEGFGVDNKHMYVATGFDFADALTGAVLAAKNDSGLLLVKNDTPSVVADYIKGQNLKKLTIFGGTLAVDESIEEQLLELLQ